MIAATTDAVLQIRDILVTAPEPIRARYRALRGKPLIAALAKIRLHDPDDGHFGLRVLADLASDAGAVLQVAAQPGAGTHWRLVIAPGADS